MVYKVEVPSSHTRKYTTVQCKCILQSVTTDGYNALYLKISQRFSPLFKKIQYNMLNYNTLATDLLWVCDFVYHRHSVSNTLADVNSSRSHSFRVCTIGYIYKIQFPWSFSDTLLLFYIKSETLKFKAPSPKSTHAKIM